jgi:hypothetical protein
MLTLTTRTRLALAGAALLTALLTPAVLADQGPSSDVVLALPATGASVFTLNQGGTSLGNGVVCTNLPGGWAAAVAGTSWIGISGDCALDRPTGEYRFATTFSLPTDLAPYDELRLTGSFMVDDAAVILLNGQQIGSGGGASSPISFSTSNRALFMPGTNTLTAVVTNTGIATALDLIATVTGRTDADEDGDADRGGRGGHGSGRGGVRVGERDDCKDGGWDELGYRNQGQCVSNAVRHGHGD